MSETRNETNQMWRDIRADAKEKAAVMQRRDIIELRERHDRGEIVLTVFSEYHVRIEGTKPGQRVVDYYTTRGTIVHRGERSHHVGLRAAIAIVERRLAPTWGSNKGDAQDPPEPPVPARFSFARRVGDGDDA